ncbi:TIGR01621 family pseudouridine synthase [Pseudoalteromonas sp. JBTF-M23]|uniref:TIGR01621 family pseudouridine synthase n=1 Tax=Pseudoalteromonas caenipelagi TaxID=2726988 RepID=A0A849V9A9_9GAMM|nr:TIGR01621 family pseudouridine synthase [Pseudoalteromonas caenipelagi]NOU49360.1 TIGR01621 family pseudouridine synthase [Pseudoalteromonas caenipelagi]
MNNIELVADEADYVVAHKTAGSSFHSESDIGFVVQLERQLGIKLYAVHRLDKVTSGLLILAKSSAAANGLSQLFAHREIDKAYLALITDKPKKKQGWIKGDMGKARRGAYKLLKTCDNPALTRLYSMSLEPGLRACILKPFTGKTHQLRVALKSLSAPILGDELYGGQSADRVYLHAYALRFNWQGVVREYTIEPSPQGHFAKLFQHEEFAKWQNPWQLEW